MFVYASHKILHLNFEITNIQYIETLSLDIIIHLFTLFTFTVSILSIKSFSKWESTVKIVVIRYKQIRQQKEYRHGCYRINNCDERTLPDSLALGKLSHLFWRPHVPLLTALTNISTCQLSCYPIMTLKPNKIHQHTNIMAYFMVQRLTN